jgi:hypothetical protein
VNNLQRFSNFISRFIKQPGRLSQILKPSTPSQRRPLNSRNWKLNSIRTPTRILSGFEIGSFQPLSALDEDKSERQTDAVTSYLALVLKSIDSSAF